MTHITLAFESTLVCGNHVVLHLIQIQRQRCSLMIGVCKPLSFKVVKLHNLMQVGYGSPISSSGSVLQHQHNLTQLEVSQYSVVVFGRKEEMVSSIVVAVFFLLAFDV